MRTIEFAILGMKNNPCRERVIEILGRVKGVNDVSVSLLRAHAVIAYGPPCEPLDLVRALESAGYGALLAGQ